MTFYPENDSHTTSEGYDESVFTRIVKAGPRTYFIDVKTTRSNDYFLSITELRKKTTPSGVVNERSKVFVYQEDFEKFTEGLTDVLKYMRSITPSQPKNE